MAIWIQSLSWALIYSLGQGIVVYASLWLVLKLVPTISASAKYHLSLSALTILFMWFATTWWQQYHALALANEQMLDVAKNATTIQLQLQAIENNGSYRSMYSLVRAILPWFSAFYLMGLVLMLVRLSTGMLQLFSLRKNGVSQPGSALKELLTSLKDRIQYAGNVQILISTKARVPMVIGCLKPIILVPAAVIAQLSIDQLETILLHELAHIKRYDYLVNILQTVVETILFFNPFVWMVSAITRREREHCCDDLVLDHTLEPLYYATALAALAKQPGAAPTFAVAASGQSNHLFNRIKRIMEMERNPLSYSRMVAAIIIITGITCSLVWLTPSFAQSKKDKSAIAKAKPAQKEAVNTNADEGSQLVQALINDHMVDETKGFTVVKKQNTLYIDGLQQTDATAGKYLSKIKQEEISIQVHPFMQRLIQHPQSGILQIVAPIEFSSPCVARSTKPGC